MNDRDHSRLLADAVRAPSSHNTQPWRFRTTFTSVEVHADRSRALPVNDSDGRELVISCGAAVCNLVVSAAHHGLAATVTPCVQGGGDHLATVTLDESTAPSDRDVALWPAIAVRATWRGPFMDRPIPAPILDEITAAGDAAGTWLQVLDEQSRSEVARLVAEGDRAQFQKPEWRRELASWMRPRRTGDGLAIPPVTGAVTRFVVRHFDVGGRMASTDAALAEASPALVVLGTEQDSPEAWLAAGQRLQRLLLTAALHGAQAGYLNQPIQVRALRSRFGELVGQAHPQLLVRLGYPPSTGPRMTRRPISDVRLHEFTSVAARLAASPGMTITSAKVETPR